jgi:hypothetical protein
MISVLTRRLTAITSALIAALLLFLAPAALAQSSINFPINVTPALTFTPASLSFPAGFNGPPQTFVLSNGIGGPAMAVSTIAISGANAADFGYASHCPASLAPGGVCQIDVSYAPTAASLESATLTITSVTTGHSYVAALGGGPRAASVPIAIALNPASGIMTPDNTPAGTIVLNAVVTTNDGSPYHGPLTIAPATVYAICGLSVCTARPLSSADDGPVIPYVVTAN